MIVATIRALKYHGGCDLKQINTENLAALEKGIANLERHVNNVRNHYGLPCVVSVNHFTADTAAEHALLAKTMAKLDVPLRACAPLGRGRCGCRRRCAQGRRDRRTRRIELPFRLRREADAVGQGQDRRHEDLRRRRHFGGRQDPGADRTNCRRTATGTTPSASPRRSTRSPPMRRCAARRADTWSTSARCGSPRARNSSW